MKEKIIYHDTYLYIRMEVNPSLIMETLTIYLD